MICKNEKCGKEFDQRWSHQKFCQTYCSGAFWSRHYKMKREHKIEELSTEIANLKKALGRKNSKANQP